jgi:membrane-associated PAP2 superfamily phosphatase
MSKHYAFFPTHLLLVPGALAVLALLSHYSGLDRALTATFYDAAQGAFPAHASSMLELVGHRLAKDAVTIVWLALLVATLSTHAWPRWRPTWTASRQVMWATVVGMALGPLIVVGLKGLNSYHCPWDLAEFGGGAIFTSNWFVAASEVGYCFPGGHAASGFCLVALYFMARALEKPQLARIFLVGSVLTGTAFSLIRLAQGAHFLSHNLWAAAICWFVAALAFVPLQTRQYRVACA